jgi:hypothetical protein
MIDMMTNQEKTLESMFQAQNSLRRHFQATDTSLDHDGDTASIFTSTTNATVLTAFDFDAVIKSTAVYQRCMKRRGDRKSLLALGSSMMQMTPSPATKDMPAGEEQDLASSINSRVAEESVEWQEFCEAGFSGQSKSESVEPDDLRIEGFESTSIDPVITISQSGNHELEARHMPSTPLLHVPTPAVESSARGETTRRWDTDQGTKKHTTASGLTAKDSVHGSSRNASDERIMHKIIEKLVHRQLTGPVVSERESGRQDERRRSSSGCIEEDALTSFAEASKSNSIIIPGHFPHSSPTITEILSNLFPTTKDTISNQISPQTHADRRRSSQDSCTDNELDRGLSVSSSSSYINGEPGVTLDQSLPDSSEVPLQGVSEKHDSAALSVEVKPIGTTVVKPPMILTGTKVLYDHQEEIINLAISSKRILAAASANTIRLWYLPMDKEIVRIPCRPHGQTNSCLMFSPDGNMLAAAHILPKELTSTVSVWNSETGARLCALTIDNGHYTSSLILTVYLVDL